MDAKAIYAADRNGKIDRHGNYSASPASSWAIREERPGKFGWISHHNESSITSNSLFFSASHRPSSMYTATELGMLKSTRKVSLLVQLQYLKTYTNAGLVELYVCDKKVGSIDALWADEHMRVSVSESFSASVSIDLSSIIQQDRWCPAAAPDERALPLVRVEHVNLASYPKTAGNANMLKRGHEKFRLISILVCMAET